MGKEEIDALFENTGGKGDAVIGNDVWTGMDAIIMPGVRVVDGVIVAARSVVVADAPDYHIVGGNSAKALTSRFDPETIARLTAIRWWDWPIEKIESKISALRSNDIDALER